MAEFGVLGSPIAHSLSPLLHTAAASAIGLTDFRYARCEVVEDGLASFLDAHPGPGGLSLTMPLKHRLIALARERGWRIDADAEATGAGNTLLRGPDGHAEVLNTDVVGITAAVDEALDRARLAAAPWGGDADVLGAGATAASAVTAAARLGVTRVRLFVRNRTRAGSARAVAESLGLEAIVCDLPDWVPGERGLTLSTLPAGALDPAVLPLRNRVDTLVLDAAYAPESAPFQRSLTERGALVIDGSRMLLHQAVAQHVRFAEVAGLSARDAAAAAPTILAAMDTALRDR
ncbi:shikimate dehydrogenase family protein [Brevibacterium yomogidense]|uniref:shikimate dehydrogenase family protein n=1 Tax=Brevibacterium yomogidense TaxID=946573 RepID=UPI0018DF03CA|nr:shikimate dehydrogenase [Brevibacterium yomogidense]